MENYERRADKVQREYERGLITDEERRQELIEIWTHATADVETDMVRRPSRRPTRSG